MRMNLPVTQQEYPFPDGVTLMSITDPQSHITYANAAFLEVSGYSREELLGQPHNVVRHPDMPPAAFADMWATLKAGDAWSALVKNRRLDGDHYWVRANATPVRRNGSLVGYMSVRTRPTAQEIGQAEALYRAFREGRAGSLRFHKGLVIRGGWLAWTSLTQRMPVRWRLRLSCLATAALPVAALAFAGGGGTLLAITAGTALAAGLAAAVWLEAGIDRPLQTALQLARSVAAGQAHGNVQMDRVDEVGMLLRAINQAGLNLRALVDDVGGQVGGLHSVSSEIAGGNADLSARTEEAASSLQQTAASMEEIGATVKSNAESARSAAEQAHAASEVANQGGEAVQRVVATMEEITLSAQRIHDIIGVIDGIAFQTNILALNAAVEAARAGEQGRGFAVVAGEVRGLAQRSAEAAKEIKALISNSLEQVKAGSALVAQAGRTTNEIVERVRRVNDLINEISSASLQQSAGIGQVGQAVSQLDEMTQRNAALVEQSAAASQSLRQRADRLVEAVSVYSNQ